MCILSKQIVCEYLHGGSRTAPSQCSVSSTPSGKGDGALEGVKGTHGGQGSRAAELWKQLGSDPEWPVFVSVVACWRSHREVGRRLHEQRAVAMECLSALPWGVGGRESKVGVYRAFWRDVHSL